jgi:hypothetical protein
VGCPSTGWSCKDAVVGSNVPLGINSVSASGGADNGLAHEALAF